jgi:filamentous hemagglutinin
MTKESLSWAADQMRQEMIKDSQKFPGVCDTQGNCLNNMSGISMGVNGDGTKVAGGRVDLEKICGEGRCTKDNTTASGYVENSDKTVKMNLMTDAEGRSITLPELLAANPTWRSEMGGWQGDIGQMGIKGYTFDYGKNSIWDKVAEAYAGTHDMLNSKIWYDEQGNIKQGMTKLETNIGEITNKTNVLLATPFALSVLLPPEVWNAIQVGIKVVKP